MTISSRTQNHPAGKVRRPVQETVSCTPGKQKPLGWMVALDFHCLRSGGLIILRNRLNSKLASNSMILDVCSPKLLCKTWFPSISVMRESSLHQSIFSSLSLKLCRIYNTWLSRPPWPLFRCRGGFLSTSINLNDFTPFEQDHIPNPENILYHIESLTSNSISNTSWPIHASYIRYSLWSSFDRRWSHRFVFPCGFQ